MFGARLGGEAAVSDEWDDKAEHLRAARANYHNVDYWRFLVREVWRIGSWRRA